MAAIVNTSLSAFHAGVEEFHSLCSAVVGHEDQDCIAVEPFFGKRGAQPADLGVDFLDRREEERHSGIDLLLVIIPP